jgi:2-polyprenyl-6-hydroxyphenyl methylase/3-demethylubiquinone-9 3-methyltransferase
MMNQFSEYATEWWNQEGPLKTLHDLNPLRLAFITQQVPLAGLSVIDVGCGGGILSEALAHSGAHVIGLDIEPGAIAAARQHAKQHQLAIDYRLEPIDAFIPERQVDVMVCMEMLEHVSDPMLVLKSAARLVKPGGYLFLSTLNRTLKSYALSIVVAEYVLNILPRQTHDYSQFIRPSELTNWLREVGFELVEMTGIRYNPITRRASRCRSVDVNYLLAARRSSNRLCA